MKNKDAFSSHMHCATEGDSSLNDIIDRLVSLADKLECIMASLENRAQKMTNNEFISAEMNKAFHKGAKDMQEL